MSIYENWLWKNTTKIVLINIEYLKHVKFLNSTNIQNLSCLIPFSFVN